MLEDCLFPGAGDHQVGAAVPPGVAGAQGGIDASQEYRGIGKLFPGQADGRGHSRVPVSHQRGDQNGGGPGGAGQFLPEGGFRDAIAAVAPGKAGQGRGWGQDLLHVAAGAERAGAGMGSGQAVDEAHGKTVGFEEAR